MVLIPSPSHHDFLGVIVESNDSKVVAGTPRRLDSALRGAAVEHTECHRCPPRGEEEVVSAA
jgi:hypothetical protein